MNAHPLQHIAVPARRLVLIIGPIASGKSTLADTLADKLRNSGEAVVSRLVLPLVPFSLKIPVLHCFNTFSADHKGCRWIGDYGLPVPTLHGPTSQHLQVGIWRV